MHPILFGELDSEFLPKLLSATHPYFCSWMRSGMPLRVAFVERDGLVMQGEPNPNDLSVTVALINTFAMTDLSLLPLSPL